MRNTILGCVLFRGHPFSDAHPFPHVLARAKCWMRKRSVHWLPSSHRCRTEQKERDNKPEYVSGACGEPIPFSGRRRQVWAGWKKKHKKKWTQVIALNCVVCVCVCGLGVWCLGVHVEVWSFDSIDVASMSLLRRSDKPKEAGAVEINVWQKGSEWRTGGIRKGFNQNALSLMVRFNFIKRKSI